MRQIGHDQKTYSELVLICFSPICTKSWLVKLLSSVLGGDRPNRSPWIRPWLGAPFKAEYLLVIYFGVYYMSG